MNAPTPPTAASQQPTQNSLQFHAYPQPYPQQHSPQQTLNQLQAQPLQAVYSNWNPWHSSVPGAGIYKAAAPAGSVGATPAISASASGQSLAFKSSAGSGSGSGGDRRLVSRVGGQGDLDVLAGEGMMGGGGGGAGGRSWWWVLILVVILAIIGLLIWWIVMIMCPRHPSDISVRDVHARDIATSGDVTVGGLTVLAGTTKIRNAVVRAFSLTPVNVSDLNVILDGAESAVTLTNQSGSIVVVTLPAAADNIGLVLYVFNASNNNTFHVEPQGTDTIEGSNATAVENSSAVFVSIGTTPSGLADWKQIS